MSSIGIAMCSALMNILSTPLIHSSISPRSYKLHIKHHPALFAENRDDDEGSVTGSLDSLISSFPSPNNVKENILEVRRFFLCITRRIPPTYDPDPDAHTSTNDTAYCIV